MAGDPLRKVRPGQKLEIPAPAYNAFVDAAKAYRAQRQSRSVEPTRVTTRHADIVRVQNTSGEPRDRFDILGIDGPIFSPEDNLDSFANEVLLRGVTPSRAMHAGRFVVLLEPLAEDAIGIAVVSGVCPVRVTLTGGHPTDENGDRFAEVIDDDATRLVSAGNGSAQLLWLDTEPAEEDGDPDTYWAIVRLGNDASTSRKAEMVGTLTQGDTSPVTAYLLEWDADAGDWYRSPQTIDVYAGPGFRGVAFGRTDTVNAGDEVDVYYDVASGRWLAIMGNLYCEGVAAEDISAGGSGSVTITTPGNTKYDPPDNGPREITVQAESPFWPISDQQPVLLAWDTVHRQWQIVYSLFWRPGCGLALDRRATEGGGPDANMLDVNVLAIAGSGLTVEEGESGECDKLALDLSLGCGLETDEAGAIQINVDDLAGSFLGADEGECTLGVKIGCGLHEDDFGGIAVNPSSIAGSGLVPEGEAQGLCQIGIDATPDNNLDESLTVLTGATLALDGCNVKLQRKARTITFKHNADGFIIGVEIGDEQDLPDSQVDVSECCCLEDPLWELEPCGGGDSILVLQSVLTLVAPPDLGGVYEDANGDCWEVITEDAEGEADEFEPARYYAPGGDPCSECPAPTLYELEPCEGGDSIIVDGDDLTEPEMGSVHQDDQGECWIVIDDDAEGEPIAFDEAANFAPGESACDDCANPPATLYHLRLCDDVNTQLVVSGDDLTTPEIGAVYKDDQGACWIVFDEDVAGPAGEFAEVEYFPPEGNPCETCTTPDPDFQCGDYCLGAANGHIDSVSLEGDINVPLAETLTYSNGQWTGQFVLSGTGDCDGTYTVRIQCDEFNQLRLWINELPLGSLSSHFSSGGYHVFDWSIGMPSPCFLSGGMRTRLPIGDCPP